MQYVYCGSTKHNYSVDVSFDNPLTLVILQQHFKFVSFYIGISVIDEQPLQPPPPNSVSTTSGKPMDLELTSTPSSSIIPSSEIIQPSEEFNCSSKFILRKKSVLKPDINIMLCQPSVASLVTYVSFVDINRLILVILQQHFKFVSFYRYFGDR